MVSLHFGQNPAKLWLGTLDSFVPKLLMHTEIKKKYWVNWESIGVGPEQMRRYQVLAFFFFSKNDLYYFNLKSPALDMPSSIILTLLLLFHCSYIL